jgi:hypothetical protein
LKGEDYQVYDASCSGPVTATDPAKRKKVDVLADIANLKREYLKLNGQLESELSLLD